MLERSLEEHFEKEAHDLLEELAMLSRTGSSELRLLSTHRYDGMPRLWDNLQCVGMSRVSRSLSTVDVDDMLQI